MTDSANESRPVLVTQPDLAPLSDFLPYLEEIWASRWVTNQGPFHRKLEAALCTYLGVEHLALFCNGTMALISALQALGAKGEIITTPYSFVATAHAILWNGLKPVFVDIDAETMNMDPAAIEAAITPQTTTILPVHCYGRPCDMDEIRRIADKHGLRVLYDAAHAFGVSRAGSSVLSRGDLSILSFHATKVFNTFEGGAIVCPDAQTKQHVDELKNFGFVNETTVVAPGINGKMNEIQAAFGLLQLTRVDAAIAHRQRIDATYRRELRDVPGIRVPAEPRDTRNNHSYFPILVESHFPVTRDELYLQLKSANILGRRYFYPLITHMPMYRDLPSASPANLPVAERIAAEVICLPIHTGMSEQTAADIAGLIATASRA